MVLNRNDHGINLSSRHMKIFFGAADPLEIQQVDLNSVSIHKNALGIFVF